MVTLANRYILPAAFQYQTVIAQNVTATKAAGVTTRENKKLLAELSKIVDEFKRTTDKLTVALEHTNGPLLKHAKYMRDTIVPLMDSLRESGDRIEGNVPSETWPLPTYREMLFIK
jgi:glutamine synthetase